VSLFVVFLWVVLAAWVVAPLAVGWRPVIISSGSMGPVIGAGDVVVVEPHDGSLLGPGSVVTFETGHGQVTHRIVEVDVDGNYVTRGDTNTQSDSDPVRPSAVVGVGRLLVPAIGLPVVWVLHASWFLVAGWVLLMAAAFWCARWGFLRPIPLLGRHGAIEPWARGVRRPRMSRIISRTAVPLLIGVLAIGVVVGTASALFAENSSNQSSALAAGDWYRFTSVAAGREFACTSNLNGEVWCWGKGNDGQLGDGLGSDSADAVRVIGAGGLGHLLGITEVVAGEAFACGLEDDGTVWCWGRGDKGQLGNNATSSLDYPVQVTGVGGSGYLTGVIDIAAGQKHACAITSSGYAYCWGENNVGQLGNNTGSNSTVPVQVTGVGGSGTLSGLTAVGSGMDHACAVGAAGAVYCWGEGSAGQLGNGATSDSQHPKQVVGAGGGGTLTGIADVDGGDTHTCARSTSDTMYCWGSNGNGQLAPASSGDATVIWKNSGDSTPDQAVYTLASGLGAAANMASVGDWRIIQGATAADGSEAIVLGVDSTRQIDGQMWTGSAWSALSFNPLGTVSDSFWWGFDVAYESQSDDAVIVWNNGSTGTASISYRVWNGSTWSSAETITTPVSGEAKQMQLAAAPDSDEMVLIVSNSAGNDYAFVWNGSSWGNSITLSTTSDNLTEVNVAYEQSSGDALVIYGKISDEIYYQTWNGSSWSGESYLTVPSGTSTLSSSRWSTIAADPNSDRIAIGVHNQVNDGWVAIWDGSAWGNELTVTNAGSGTDHPWMAVAFEGSSGDALVTYGETNRYVRYRTWQAGGSWGGELDGPDMGTAEYVNSMVLYPRSGSNDIMFVGQDDDSDLELYPWNGSSWGAYVQPTAGTGEVKNQPFLFLWDVIGITGAAPSSSSSPLPVAGPGGGGTMTGVSHIATGTTFTCASLTSGAAYCWGRNDKGQLGDNTTTDRTVPTRVVGTGGSGAFGNAGLLSGSHSTGTFTCSTRTDPTYATSLARHDEQVWCWGRNDRGQLGDGTTTERHYPVRVNGI
jgi:signal peptidase I